MKQAVISVDPSLRSTGLTVLSFDGEMFEIELLTLPSEKGDADIQVYKMLFSTVHQLCRKHTVVFGIVEGYSFGSEGNARSRMIEAGTSCRLGIAMCGVPFVELPPPKWKNVVLKNGAASKKEIREKVALLTAPGKRPKNKLTRLFLEKLPPEAWSSPDELDSLLIMVAFFVILLETPDYFRAKAKNAKVDDVLDSLREGMIGSLKTHGMLR